MTSSIAMPTTEQPGLRLRTENANAPVPDPTSSDPSREYVAYALDHDVYGARGAFEIGDAQKPRFRDATFDGSLSLLVFGDFEDYWNPFLLKQGPAGSYAATLDRERLQALREQVKLRLRVRSESRGIDLPARAWAVRGTV